MKYERTNAAAAWLTGIIHYVKTLVLLPRKLFRAGASFLIQKFDRDILKRIIVALILKLVGSGLLFFFNLLLARRLGTEGAGIFYLALTITTIASLIARLGIDNALVRFAAVAAAEGRWSQVSGLYRRSMQIAGLLALVVTALIVSSAPLIAERVFAKALLARPLQIMALTILPFSLLTLHGELLRGLNRTRDSMLVQAIGIPLVNLLFLIILAPASSIVNISLVYGAATFLVLAFGFYLWRRATPQLRGVNGTFDLELLISTSIPLFWVSLLGLLMNSVDTIVLGIFSQNSNVGIYSVTSRVAATVGLLLVAVNTVTAPRFAELYAQGKLVALEKLARTSAQLTMLIGAPVLLLFIGMPTFVLGFFGDQFRAGGTVLSILAVGQFINAATGSVGYLLVMSGNEKIMRNIMLVVVICQIGLSVALVAKFGVIGAAWSNTISVSGFNISLFVAVYKKLSISTLPLPGGRSG